VFSASQRQQAKYSEGMFLHRWFAILNVCNLLTRQDEVLSLTPNVGLFFIVQIVSSFTNHNIRFVIDLQSFFDEGLQRQRKYLPR
jgi:hypothetical protein